MKYLKNFNENVSKKDIDVYRMSLYPDKGKKSGSDEMIDNIGKKLRSLNAKSISYELKSNDDVLVDFTIDEEKYTAKYNHTGTCENVKIKNK
jgi:hypothetical protein